MNLHSREKQEFYSTSIGQYSANKLNAADSLLRLQDRGYAGSNTILPEKLPREHGDLDPSDSDAVSKQKPVSSLAVCLHF
jgi:hypothetical protein